MELILIREFLELVEKHGQNELSDNCEICVQIKKEMQIIQTALSLQKLVEDNIKIRNGHIMRIGLIPEIVEQLETLVKKAKRFGKTYINHKQKSI